MSKAKLFRKNLTSKLREKNEEPQQEDPNKPQIILPPTRDPNKKQEDDFDPLTYNTNDTKKNDDPLALLGLLEDKKKQKEKECKLLYYYLIYSA